MDYIYKQRTLRESINQLLKTGNIDLSEIKDLKVLKKYLDEINQNEAGDSNLHERVFVTEKTQGFRKEQEVEKLKKRDQKAFYKQSDMVPCFEPYHANFDASMADFYAQGQPNFAYPPKGRFDNDNYDDLYREPMPQMPFLHEEMIDNRMIYPSQNPEFNSNKNGRHSSNKNDLNSSLIEKVLEDDIPDFDNILNKRESDIFPGEITKDKVKVKKEFDEESDLFAGFTQNDENSKDANPNIHNFDKDLFGDPFSNADNLELDDSEDDNSDDYDDDDDEDSDSDDPNKINSKLTKDFEDSNMSGIDNQNSDFMHRMPVYMDGHDPMSPQMYGQSPYMMKPPMYDGMYQGHSHSLLNSPYIKAEAEMGGYMGYNPNEAEMAYYRHQKGFKNDMRSDRPSMRGRKRNKYKMLPTDLKHKAVYLAKHKSAKYASTFYSVPLKSLKRWMKVGCERKKGGGRKTKDPLMEKNLYSWYIDMKTRGEVVTAKMIKDRAIELTNCADFIASKGWLDKFKVRFNLEISKESCKDSTKRRFNPCDSLKKRNRMYHHQNLYEADYDNYKSVRRSLNKSVKQEIDQSYLDEGIGSIKVRPDSKLWKSKTHIKKEISDDGKKIGSILDTKNEVASIFASKPNENQFKYSKIDNSSNNVISLPLCDADNSGEEFTEVV